MRKTRLRSKADIVQATSSLPEVDPGYRDERDPDPVVEEMVERLRANLSGMVALDEWNRPVAWRNVVRLALGPSLRLLHSDVEESDEHESRVIVLPSDRADRPQVMT